jgi:hypothetical protein
MSLETTLFNWLALDSGELETWPPRGSEATLRGDLYQRIESQVAAQYPDVLPGNQIKIAKYVFAHIDSGIQGDIAEFLNRSMQDFKRKAQAQPIDDLELARLENAVARERQLLELFRAQMVASDISQAVETTELGSKIEIMDPAQLPLEPSRPNRVKILLASVLLGPLLGAGFALLAEIMDTTVRTLDEIQRIIPEPVLGMTPLMSKLRSPRRGIRRYWIPAALTGVVLFTAAFFVARTTVLRDTIVEEPIQLVNPEDVVSP